jgi:hypothetical protein
MERMLRYIKKYKIVFVIVLLGLSSLESNAQTRKFSFGFNAGYEFASAYFEKHKDLPTNERITGNYSIGLMVERLNDSSLISFTSGVYFKYRSFRVNVNVDNLDPNYTDYLTTIKPEYYIFGFPITVNWNLIRKGRFSFGVKTGMALEVLFYTKEKSEFNNGEVEDSQQLTPYYHDKKIGVPLVIGLGADINLDKNIKIGLYPVMNLYMKKFYSTTEAGYSSVFGVNLFVLF